MDRVPGFTSRHALALIVAAGAALRLATLGTQSFWLDEQVTLQLVPRAPFDLLKAIPLSESNPALYYLLQAAWERLFGDSEVAIRSLSALAGTATIPFVYGAAKELGSRRAGLFAAGLAATSPMLIWYSQEARNYAVFALLAAVGLYCFARALNEDGHRWLWLWALASGLALCTHYFAVFLIAPQLGWLLWQRRASRRDVIAAAAAIGVVALALLPVFATQRGRGSWIDDYDLGGRLLQVPEHFLVGLEVPWQALPGIVLAVVGLAAIACAVAGGEPVWRRAAVPLGLFAAGLALLLLAVALGEDYILSRNLIGLWPPFAVGLALVLAAAPARTLGAATVVAVCLLGAGLAIWLPATTEARKPDYAELARALGPTDEERLIVSQTTFSSPLPLYLDDSQVATEAELSASDLVVIEPRAIADYAVGTCWWIHTCGGEDLSPPPPFEVPPGFERTGGGSTAFFDFAVYEAAEPVAIERPLEYFTPRVFRQAPPS